MTPLTIHRLEVTNFMGVRGVTLELDDKGNLIVIGGDNGAGKTSTIDAIWAAIGGKPSQSMPITKGEEYSEIKLDLGELVVTRRLRIGPGGKLVTDLKVSTKDGANYQRPQEVLDKLLSKFAFDPFEFTRLKPKEQVEALKRVLSIDTTELEARRQDAYDERSMVNRELAALKARHSGMPDYPDAPDDEVRGAELTARLQDAAKHNSEIKVKRSEAEQAAHRLAAVDEHIKAKEDQIADLERQIAAQRTTLAEWQQKRGPIETAAIAAQKLAEGMAPIDTHDLERQLAEIDETNRQVRAKRERRQAQAAWEEAEARRIALTKVIEECDQAKAKLAAEGLSAAKIAIEGIDLGEDGLYVNGIPFSQCNTAVQLQVSVALAVHENPRLRVYRIADGEKLTPKSVSVIRQIAEEHGAQIFMEMAVTAADVEQGYREVSFLIEDGRLAGQEPSLELVHGDAGEVA